MVDKGTIRSFVESRVSSKHVYLVMGVYYISTVVSYIRHCYSIGSGSNCGCTVKALGGVGSTVG